MRQQTRGSPQCLHGNHRANRHDHCANEAHHAHLRDAGGDTDAVKGGGCGGGEDNAGAKGAEGGVDALSDILGPDDAVVRKVGGKGTGGHRGTKCAETNHTSSGSHPDSQLHA